MILSSLIPPISPAITGLLVGAVSGALAFVAFALVIVRRRAQQRDVQAARQAPPWLRENRELAARQVVQVPPYAVLGAPVEGDDVDLDRVATRAFQRPRGKFTAQLSASSLANMGLHVGPFGQRIASEDEDVDLSELDATPAVTVSPCIIITDEPKTVHPLGIIRSSSLALVLPTDDSPTEIGETFFDMKPNPLAAAPRPKIRPITPAAPRFGG